MNTDSEVAAVFRAEYGLVLATLIRSFGDFDLAEESLQEAFSLAVRAWRAEGMPERPAAWLTTTARRKGIDRLRRDANLARKTRLLETAGWVSGDRSTTDEEVSVVTDERLRLIFTCCHPALALESQVALTLRTLGGLTSAQIARGFLTSEAAIYQRITRAKRKIRDARIPYEVPTDDSLTERVGAVLAVIYLIYNEAHSSTSGDDLNRPDLAGEAIRLAETVVSLMPDEAEAVGLLALLLLTDARRAARLDSSGELVLLEDQNRKLWDREMITRGLDLVAAVLRRRQPGPYQLQAAIAAVHAQAEAAVDTDWMQIAALYGELGHHQPSPVIALNQAVAVAMWRGPEAGLALIGPLADRLDQYRPFHVARADLLARVGRKDASATAYRQALALPGNNVEDRYLRRRLDELGGAPD